MNTVGMNLQSYFIPVIMQGEMRFVKMSADDVMRVFHIAFNKSNRQIRKGEFVVKEGNNESKSS